MSTLLRNVQRVDAPGLISLRIDGNLIDRVGDDTDWPASDEVVDAHGKLAIPGFVNAHTHLAMVLLRGLADDVPLDEWLERHVWPFERTLTPEDVYWGTLLALAESLRGGVVAVADMYFHMDAVARAVEDSGLRAVLSYGVIAPSMQQGGETELAAADRFAQRWHGKADGRIHVAISPHAVTTCGADVWHEAIALAGDRGLLLHTHLSESEGEVAASQAATGQTPPAALESLGAFELPTLAAHCVHLSRGDVALLAQRGVSVAHCPKSNAKLANGIAPVRALRDAGVRVALGTDGACSNNRLDLIEELRFACFVSRARETDTAACTARDVVRSATMDGRLALRLPACNLHVGDVADIVLLRMDGADALPPHDPAAWLAFAAASADVSDVFVGGRPLVRDGRVLAIDEERVQLEVGRLFAGRRT